MSRRGATKPADASSTRVVIAAPSPENEDAWRSLWSAYLSFYRTTVDDSVYAETWARFFRDHWGEPRCRLAFLARADGGARPIGLVHYLFHRHCWRLADICYLQDLYVDPAARGSGAAKALIEAVYDETDQLGAEGVYWTTQEFNYRARSLYDQVGERTPFIKYQRPHGASGGA